MKVALRTDGCPLALFPGILGNPLIALPQSSLRPGPWDLQILPRSRLAWESPHGRLIVPLLPLFLCRIVPVISILHTAAAAQESVAAAETAAGAQVSCWWGLSAQSWAPWACPRVPAVCPGGGVHGTRLCSIWGILALGAWGGEQETLGPGPPLSSYDIGRHTQSRLSTSAPVQVRIPVSQFPSLLSTGLPVLVTGPNKGEEMKV